MRILLFIQSQSFIIDRWVKKSILLINCHNFCFFSLTAKVLSFLSILVFQSNVMLCKNVFLLHFSIMLRRLFDDQNFIVLFNFFFNVWEILGICQKYFYMLFQSRKSNLSPFQLWRVLRRVVNGPTSSSPNPKTNLKPKSSPKKIRKLS